MGDVTKKTEAREIAGGNRGFTLPGYGWKLVEWSKRYAKKLIAKRYHDFSGLTRVSLVRDFDNSHSHLFSGMDELEAFLTDQH